MNVQLLLLQAGNAGLFNLVFFGAMILILYMFMIRPQAKRQKEQKAFMEGLQKGDEVVTASGIIGRINKMEDDIVTLEVGSKIFIRVIKTSISKEMTDSVNATNG